jgi:hypothetical protein
MTDLGKLLVFLGGTVVVVEVVVILFGRLPGDIVYRGKNTIFYFPLATSIVISIVLSVLMYVIGNLRK